MLSYIASNSTARLIKDICKEQNITILNQEVEEIDFLKYIKQTKVNFNLIKYLIIDLSQLKNTEDEVINSIKYFKEMYINTRIIVIAEEIRKCLSQEGLQEKDARRFKKIEIEKVDKKLKYQDFLFKLKEKFKSREKQNKNIETQNQINSSVYFFAILMDAIKNLVRLVCYISVFVLTSLGLTFLFNDELRNMVFQILGLK